MPTSVKIIKDSTNWLNKRLTTWILEYPRYIHSEMLTHRVFSKNSASSRAIPYPKMVQNIRDNMVGPIWTKTQKGMQGGYLQPMLAISAGLKWEEMFELTTRGTDYLHSLGIHKQNINRLLEPWMHIKVILTGTDFDNWFALRAHKDAQPEIQELAYLMQAEYEKSVPTLLQPGMWHIPLVDSPFPVPEGQDMMQAVLKTSVARCARISYNNVDGSSSTVEKDIELFDKLIVSEPLHASPAEHQAQVPLVDEIWQGHFNSGFEWRKDLEPNWQFVRGKYVSNLCGWKQLRKVIEAKEF